MQLGQFSAFISVDGVPLPEFSIEYSPDGLEGTCWIASEDDKEFRVEFKDKNSLVSYPISVKTRVDGTSCGSKLLKTRRGTNISTGKRDSVASSATTRRQLKFGRQLLTDDDSYLQTAIPAELGSISVIFRHVKSCDRLTQVGTRGDLEPTVLHERSKKGMGHSVQFGPEFHRVNKAQSHSKTIKTLATLIFRYRPIDLLRARGIAPSNAGRSNVADDDFLKSDDDVDEDEDIEIKRLEARLASLKNKKQTKHVKQERSTVKKEIKSEKIDFIPGEVIDLT
ncbi:hypothetical protein R3P38DRAFT_3037434 [Favolaschia claudopus]|uniref:DUF7918 domain-containing protein n=1 Tax=Favolaschia claudopus TaxID=2862362 RepID=A0AAW0ACH2_9AGAR